ncbi:MAG: hypothetical protein A2Z91_00505 [Deltaproteobacteria bacterium GWA2_38_16]|nr:MAG: hypothetical protein A2Z91_00505 [Deltaproteobacteria bacterium GWA2_38_16]OGQ03582.1 MAG: hypothetical protein A3D19_01910 [Deltaproteobacteria bacterium RIFCSPHIGHO2_02_FULL_38_15]OGQ30160.1 MAG: hypothetical protein A3A72_01530 [Deltaproteobacteria bacterium RIFCSPLOWO2_01_FULL_38_9]
MSILIGAFALTYCSGGGGGGGDGGSSSGGEESTSSSESISNYFRVESSVSHIIAGKCSGPYTVKIVDPKGKTITVSEDTYMDFMSGSSAFFADANCTKIFDPDTDIQALFIPTGKESAEFYLKNPLAGTMELEVSGSGLDTKNPLLLTIEPTTAEKLSLDGSPYDVEADRCQGPYSVYTRDQYENDTSVSQDTVVTLEGGSQATFYEDDGCNKKTSSITVLAGNRSQKFYLKSSATEALIIEASTPDFQGKTLSLYASGASAAVGQEPPQVFLLGSSDLFSGSCASYVMMFDDKEGNSFIKDNYTASFNLDKAKGGKFYLDECGTGISNFPIIKGQKSQKFYFKSTNPGEALIEISIPELEAFIASFPLTIKPRDPSKLKLICPEDMTAGFCTPCHVQTVDHSENMAPVREDTSIKFMAINGQTLFYSDMGCSSQVSQATLAKNQDTLPIFVKETVAGTIKLSAYDEDDVFGSSDRSINVKAAEVHNMILQGPPDFLVAGTCSSEYTLKIVDDFGNLTSDTQIRLSNREGQISFYEDRGCQNALSSFDLSKNEKSFYVKGEKAGSFFIFGESSRISSRALSSVTIEPGDISNIFISGDSTIKAGDCHKYQVFAKDSYGNGTGLEGNSVLVLSGQEQGMFYVEKECAGQSISQISMGAPRGSVSFYYKGRGMGDVKLKATLVGQQREIRKEKEYPVTVIVGKPSRLVLTFDTQTFGAGQCVKGSAALQDLYENLASFDAPQDIFFQKSRHLKLFSDSSCTQSLTSRSGFFVSQLSSKLDFYMKNSATETDMLYAESHMLRSAAYVITTQALPMAMSSAAHHTCAIIGSGLKCWGENNFGQLGDGTKTNRLKPVFVSELTMDVSAISVGSGHACAIQHGKLKCWGYGEEGQLGGNSSGKGVIAPFPIPVSNLGSDVVSVSAGYNHTCAIVGNTRGLECWGKNQVGQLGDGTSQDRSFPNPVNGLGRDVWAVSAGGSATCAIVGEEKALKCWGLSHSSTPEEVVQGLEKDVVAVSTGSGDGCAIVGEEKALKCWNTSHQLTTIFESGVSSVVVGGNGHTCAIQNGGLKCWGLNDHGQVGNGEVNDSNEVIPMVSVPGLESGVSAVALGSNHTCVIQNDKIKCWGMNHRGQVGQGFIDVHVLSPGIVGTQNK